MTGHADRIDLALDKALAERSLHEFFVQSWRITTPGSELCDGWHLEAIAEHLEAVVTWLILDLLILIPPRCGKTILGSVCCQRGHGFESPNCSSCARPMGRISATDYSVDCRRLMLSPWYRRPLGPSLEDGGRREPSHRSQKQSQRVPNGHKH